MPTSFLTPDHRNAFGRFRGPPAPEELARYFHLDGADLATVRQMRGRTNRLGFAILLCGVRFTGRFIAQSSDVPDEVIVYIADQLDKMVPGNLPEYFDSSAPTYKRHTALIRVRFEYRDFHQAPDAGLGLMRRLYGFCWSGEDKPTRLIEWACNWLISNRILLPGPSTLERLVGRIRERTQGRLWQALVDGLTADQRNFIGSLLEQDNESLGDLDLLRARPLKRRQSDFLRHLDRLDALRDVGLRMTPPKGVPAMHLERLARVARRAKPSAIVALTEPRRTATVAALFYTLEASAQDDALELGEALIADLLRETELAKANHRQEQQRDLDKAVLLLRDLASHLITDEAMPFKNWQSALFDQWPKTRIEDAISTVDTFILPDTGKPVAALTARWHRAHKLFFNITTRIDLAGSPGGQDVTEAMNWLRDHPDWAKAPIKTAPTGVVSKSWRPHVMDKDGVPTDSKAYVFAAIDAWHKAVKRRDVFAAPGIRYADPRAGLMQTREWERSKGVVCRTLGRTLDGATEIRRLADELDATFARVAARADDNPDLRFEIEKGKPAIVLSKLDRLDEPESLSTLRRDVRNLMPRAGIPDILLEVMHRTEFTRAFTHLSERPPKVQGFEVSLCAALIAQACNIGIEPLVREEHPTLRHSRLGWVAQNFIRSETLAAANAMIAAVHSKLPITNHWGDGQVASADGMRFLAPKTAIHAGPNPKYFGRGCGITWYNMLSDQYSGLGAMVVPDTLRDSLAILALLLEQETELDPSQIMTDTGAYSDTIFGLFWLLGYQFCPRLADIGGARLWRVDKTANYGPPGAIAEGTINIKLISTTGKT